MKTDPDNLIKERIFQKWFRSEKRETGKINLEILMQWDMRADGRTYLAHTAFINSLYHKCRLTSALCTPLSFCAGYLRFNRTGGVRRYILIFTSLNKSVKFSPSGNHC